MSWSDALLVFAVFFPIYVILRLPFLRLPLHIDTGFYVSNHLVATGTFQYRSGWNARYAGCSKVVPEFVYSFAYLIAQRVSPHGSSSYAISSRIVAMLYNFVTAGIVGMTLCQLWRPEPTVFLCAAITYAMLSSEAQYGVYYENGELFEIPFHAGALMLLVPGIAEQNMLYIALASFIAMTGSYFVKLSSIITWGIVFVVVGITNPATLVAFAVGALVATTLYVLWMFANRQSPLAMLEPLWGHETACGQRLTPGVIMDRLRSKMHGMLSVFRRQPIFPLLAIVGLFGMSDGQGLLCLYGAGLFVAYVFQAADCWYYRIPFLLPLAFLATVGLTMLQALMVHDVSIILPVVCLWAAHNTLRAIRMNRDQLARWVWDGHVATDTLTGDLELESVARSWRSELQGRTLFVYGSFNQAYAMLGASYPTAMVAAERYLDDMAPDWQSTLATQLVSDPPEYILDTGNVFASEVMRTQLGLDYKLHAIHADRFRLFRLERVANGGPCMVSARTYRPQSAAELQAERNRSGSIQVTHSNYTADANAEVLAKTLSTLGHAGLRNVAIYGAGQFTIRHATLLREATVNVAVVLDDQASETEDQFMDWPIVRPEQADEHDIDAIVICSDRHARIMDAKAKAIWGTRWPVVRWDRPEAEAVNPDTTEASHQRIERPLAEASA